MSGDNDGDSQMPSSPSSSSIDIQSSATQGGLTSPPSSQQQSLAMELTSNANGKRPLNTISNGLDDSEEIAAMANGAAASSGRARNEHPPKTHEPSGYTWTREEDTPGYSWLNKKATHEASRAWEVLCHRDNMVNGKYGDPFEVAEKEQAIINSLKQQ